MSDLPKRCLTGLQVGFPRLVGVVLLLAAAFKIHAYASGISGMLLWPRATLFGVVEMEVLLGAWLVSGLCPASANLAAIVCFGTFTAINLRHIMAEDAACECFGIIRFGPSYMACFDIAVVAVLVLIRLVKPAVRATQISYASRRCFIGLAVAGGISALSIPASRPGQWLGGGEEGLPPQGELVVLAPQHWPGKDWPLIGQIDIGERLKYGKWVIVLYRPGCNKCRELIEQIGDAGQTVSPPDIKVALVEIPAEADTNTPLPGEPSHTRSITSGRLSERWRWFAQVPIRVDLVDGRVVAVSSGRDASLGLMHASLAR